MLVSDVIGQALAFLDMNGYLEKLNDGGDESDEEYTRAIGALLHCFNAVEDELSRGYFPLVCSEEVTVSDGKLYYTALSRTPVKILRLHSLGRAARFAAEPEYLAAKDGVYTIEYAYCPLEKSLEESSDYDESVVGTRLIAYGVCAEYCLITGAYEASECWEARYVRETERLRPLPHGGRIPARRWV